MSKPQGTPPYPGLRPFRAEEDYLFFGREEQTTQLLKLLRQHRFLAVVGASGSGKSSLVRAGLLPALLGGTIVQAGSSWEVVLLRPGGDPVTNLAHALIEAGVYDEEDPESLPRLRATLSRSRAGLFEAVRQSEIEPETNLLVVVDQFEELFRYRQSGTESQESATAFVKLLLAATQQSERPIYVTITMRSDYLGECAEIPGLAEAVNDGEYLIPRLSREQRRAAIEKPAAVGGARISTRLLHRLLNDVGDDADQLPVLQHALMRMWEFWANDHGEDEPLDLRHYEQAGGLAEALSRHADEVFDQLPDDRHQQIAEKLFKALTERGVDHRGIRRPTRLGHLVSIADASLDELTTVADAFRAPGVTFLMPMSETRLTRRTVIDISHESLMRVWKRLTHWVEEESLSARIYRRLADTATLHAEGKAGVYHDPDLQIAVTWRDSVQPNEAWGERYHPNFRQAIEFLEKSEQVKLAEQQARDAARQRELDQARLLAEEQRKRIEDQARSTRRLRGLVASLSLLAVVAVAACITAAMAWNEASINASKAEDEAEVAARRSEELERERKKSDWNHYVSTIVQAQLSLQQQGKASRIPELLPRWKTDNPAEDLRGWEWHFLNAQHDASLYTIPAFRATLKALFSPDGKRVALTKVNTICVWDLESGQEVMELAGFPGIANWLRWSPDGRMIAVGTAREKGIHIWDARTGMLLLSVSGTPVLVNRGSWSSDSRRIALVDSSGRNIEIWEVFSRERRQRIEVGVTHGVDWHPTENRLAVSLGSSVAIWDLDKEEIVDRLTGSEGTLGDFGWSPDGLHLAAIDGRSKISIWSKTENAWQVGERISSNQRMARMDWSPDSRKIAATAADGIALIWDAGNGNLLRSFNGHSRYIFSVNWSPDGKQLLTSGYDGTAKIWDAASTSQLGGIVLGQVTDGITGAAWSPGGDRVAVAGDHDGVTILGLGDIESQSFACPDGRLVTVAWSQDRRWLAGISEQGRLWIWKADTHELHAGPLGSDLETQCLCWSPDSSRLLTASLSSELVGAKIVSWSLDTPIPVSEELIDAGDFKLYSLAWSPDGTLIGAAGRLRFPRDSAAVPQVRVWNVEDDQSLATSFKLPNSEAMATVLAFRHDSRQLAIGWRTSGPVNTGATIGLITIFDIGLGRDVGTIQAHSDQVNSIQWSHKGARIISASDDRTLKMFALPSQQELLTLEPHDGAVTAGLFSPDETRILTTSSDGTVCLLDASSSYREERSDQFLTTLSEQIELGQGSAEVYRLRGEILAYHGRWHEAQADLDKSAGLKNDEKPGWIVGPWWTLGAFPGDVTQLASHEPLELPPNPLQPVSGGRGPATLEWRPVTPDDLGGINLGQQFGQAGNISCFVYTRVYSPISQEVGLLIGSDDYHALWFNNELVHENRRARVGVPDQDAVIVELQPGWNDVLFKVVNHLGRFQLYARVSDNTSQIANVFANNGQFDACLTLWDKRLGTGEPEPAWIAQRSRHAEAAGNLDLAIADVERLLQAYPDNVALLTRRSELYRQQQRWELARADLDRAEMLLPDSWDIRLQKGRLDSLRGWTFAIEGASTWRWFHPLDGKDPGLVDPDFHETFYSPDFADAHWQEGEDSSGTFGGFGYSRNGHAQAFRNEIGHPQGRHPAYFRCDFTTHEALKDVTLSLTCHDGVIVYLDGVEVARDNVLDKESFQAKAQQLRAFSTFRSNNVVFKLPEDLSAGEHVLAISLHRAGRESTVMSLSGVTLKGRPLDQVLPELDDPVSLVARGIAYFNQMDQGLGLADFEKATELFRAQAEAVNPMIAESLYELAVPLISSNSLPLAQHILDLAIEVDPNHAAAFFQRGRLHARKRNWQAAADDLSRSMELNPDEHWTWYQLSSLLIETGQVERYQELKQPKVEHFKTERIEEGEVDSVLIDSADRSVEACLWQADSEMDWEALIQASSERLPHVNSVLLRKYRQVSIGELEYRAGDSKTAIEIILRYIDDLNDPGRARSLAFLAMAYHDQGDTGNAESCLNKLEGLLDLEFIYKARSSLQDDLGTSWHDWLAARILRREAVAKIRGPIALRIVEGLDHFADGEHDKALEKLEFPEFATQGDPQLYGFRGELHVVKQEYEAALADYQESMRLEVEADDSSNPASLDMIKVGVLMFEVKGPEAHAEFCLSQLERYVKASQPTTIRRLAKIACLSRSTPRELEPVFDLFHQSNSGAPGVQQSVWIKVVEAWVALRQNQPQKAVDVTRALNTDPRWNDVIRTQSHLIQALACQQLGDYDSAQEALKQARELMNVDDSQLTPARRRFREARWYDWLICRILLDEAEAAMSTERSAPVTPAP